MSKWFIPVLTDEVKPMAVRRDPVAGPDRVPDERVSLGEYWVVVIGTAVVAFFVGYGYGALFGG